MILAVDPSLAANTLHTLARMQGTHVDPRTEEQPGKILHELRRDLTTVAETPAGSIYYGSVDAMPLFVVVLGALHRWGAPDDVVRELLPRADQALAWIEEHGDRDGDGFVEHQRSSEHGLANQGWKDSFDAVGFADGRLANTPIALCEVQGYVYAAYLAHAQIAALRGCRYGGGSGGAGFLAQGGVQSTVLIGGIGPRRAGSGPRETPDRRAHVQHRALPVEGHRGRGQGGTDR